MATYRERRLARAERLREWGEKRVVDGDAKREGARAMVAMIPLGQPIHGQADRRRREKSFEAYGRAIEHGAKGAEMVERAASIEAQAAGAIYSDDPDAVERLQEKIAGLEAERDRIKRYNASCRKAAKAGEQTGDLSILTEAERDDLLTTARVASYMIGKGGAMPGYKLTNLSGNISRLRKRLEGLQREQVHGPRDRVICARFGSECASCGARLEKDSLIRYNRQDGARCHPACQNEGGE